MPSHEKEVNTAYGRFLLDGGSDAKMAARLAAGAYPQQEVLDLVDALDANTIVDVGAHIGTVTVPLAARGKKVIAFEPNPLSYGYLEQNCQRNGITPDIRNKGLGSAPGHAHMVARQSGNAGAHSLEAGGDIEVSTLSTEVAAADFIKIDVEGMELSVLEGAEKLITESRPAIYFEVNLSALRAHHVSLAALTRFFNRSHYALYVVEHAALYRLSGLMSAAFLIAPRSLLFGSRSAPFDVLALPSEAVLPYRVHGQLMSLMYLCARYFKLQYGRFFNT